MSDLVLGIDGGGTKTVAWLAGVGDADSAPPLAQGASGPGNPRAAGFDAALANIDAAISAAFAALGQARVPVRAAGLALAGADRPAEKQTLTAWLEQRQVADRLVLTNDVEPLLAVGSPEAWGVALVAGTGSMAFGRDPAGRTVRCGGWGYLFGDEGSGYAIGVAGLRAAARAADGRSPPTRLLELILQRFQVATPQDLVAAVYQPGVQRAQIAELSQCVFQAAAEGDAQATAITTAAAQDLAKLVETVCRTLALPAGGYALSLAGGLIIHHATLRDAVTTRLAATPAAPGSIMLVPDPVRGAVILARKAAG